FRRCWLRRNQPSKPRQPHQTTRLCAKSTCNPAPTVWLSADQSFVARADLDSIETLPPTREWLPPCDLASAPEPIRDCSGDGRRLDQVAAPASTGELRQPSVREFAQGHSPSRYVLRHSWGFSLRRFQIPRLLALVRRVSAPKRWPRRGVH